MLVAYISRTGNIDRFVKKSGVEKYLRIFSGGEIIPEPFVLITYTTGLGEVPEEIIKLLDNQLNASNLRGIVSSGNRSFGTTYGKAANIISKKYKVPLLMKFELSGREPDVEKFKTNILKLQ